VNFLSTTNPEELSESRRINELTPKEKTASEIYQDAKRRFAEISE
jgi:hypothetical protein